jgi:hypothetical protein
MVADPDRTPLFGSMSDLAVIQEQHANATCEGGMFGGNFLSAARWRCPDADPIPGFRFFVGSTAYWKWQRSNRAEGDPCL